jgi:[ribosomal protein S5]-alanine N-acetyltransferase
MSFPELATARLRLRQIRRADQPHVFAGLSHPDVVRHYGVWYDSLEATAAQMDWYEQLWTEQTGVWWALWAGGTFVGACGFNDWKPEHRRAELGYWLLPAYGGRGLMREALDAALGYAFGPMHLHRAEAYVETGNAASGKLLERLGFRHEGTLVDCEIKHGAFISLQVWARVG